MGTWFSLLLITLIIMLGIANSHLSDIVQATQYIYLNSTIPHP